MAVTDRATTHALAQEFAAMLQNEPTVRRLWYVGEPSRYWPEVLNFQFYMLRDKEDEESDDRILQAATEFQERHDQNVSAVLIHLNGEWLHGDDLLEEIPTDGIELPLHGR